MDLVLYARLLIKGHCGSLLTTNLILPRYWTSFRNEQSRILKDRMNQKIFILFQKRNLQKFIVQIFEGKFIILSDFSKVSSIQINFFQVRVIVNSII